MTAAPRQILILFFFLTGNLMMAQDLPATDLFLFDLKASEGSSYELSMPRLLNGFNIGGYNNQPHFLSGHELIFSCRVPGESQNDLYILDLNTYQKRQFTATRESEYSPWYSRDRDLVYCVQTDLHQPARQKLWAYPIDQSNFGRTIWNTEEEVGYFSAIDQDHFAVFTLGDPHRIFKVNTATNEAIRVGDRIGRCLKTTPDGELLFIHETSDDIHYLKEFDPQMTQAKVLTRMPLDVKDFCYHEGQIWYGQGAKLMLFDPAEGKHREIEDLGKYGINRITRLDVHGTLLVIVNEK